MNDIRQKKQYRLFRRQWKRGKIYYVQFRYDDETWATAKSLGVTSKKEAETIVLQALISTEGKIKRPSKKTFRNFATKFFDEKGEWAQEKNVIGRRNSKANCVEKQREVDKFLMPELADLELSKINLEVIKRIRLKLYNMIQLQMLQSTKFCHALKLY